MDAAVFRDMNETDLAEGLRLSRACGWNQTLADWRLMLALGPGFFRVGVEGGRIVASGGAVRYGRDLAWICMILVDPACRGRGLGTRVFDEVLARLLEARDRHELETIGLDATPAGRGLYAKRGFVEGPAILRMRREPGLQGAEGRGGDEATRRMAPADVEAVLDLDRRVFGADREAVLRDALASAPALARVAVDGHRVRGYCLGRHGDHSDHIGPVVADGPDLALSLVGAALTSAGRRAAIVDARAEPAWTGALGALGFRPQRPLTRMYLGDARPASTPALELAVRGPEMG